MADPGGLQLVSQREVGREVKTFIIFRKWPLIDLQRIEEFICLCPKIYTNLE